MSIQDKQDKFYATIWGLFLGDSIAIASHGYTNFDNLKKDYGYITDFLDPLPVHPEATMFQTLSQFNGDYTLFLGEKRAKIWQTPCAHFHKNLKKGDNTLSAILALNMMKSLVENKKFSKDDIMQKYINLFSNPDSYKDTYIPAGHRDFFTNYFNKKPIENCAVSNNHLGGLVQAIILMLTCFRQNEQIQNNLRQIIMLMQKNESLVSSSFFINKILAMLIEGIDLEEIIYQKLKNSNINSALAFPYRRWIQNHSDEEVARQCLGTSVSCEDALPLVLFLALKYKNNLTKALIVNTNLGGDSTHSGSFLGAILGAQNGCMSIPQVWVNSLTNAEQISDLTDKMWDIFGPYS